MAYWCQALPLEQVVFEVYIDVRYLSNLSTATKTFLIVNLHIQTIALSNACADDNPKLRVCCCPWNTAEIANYPKRSPSTSNSSLSPSIRLYSTFRRFKCALRSVSLCYPWTTDVTWQTKWACLQSFLKNRATSIVDTAWCDSFIYVHAEYTEMSRVPSKAISVLHCCWIFCNFSSTS